jgi:hypothetical protein
MKRAIIAGLLVLILFAVSEQPRFVILVETPQGSIIELASQRLTCADTRILLEETFGTRSDCQGLCLQGSNFDGSYAFHTGVIPALRCIGPREPADVSGTGTLTSVPVSFCVDDGCTAILDYCDCVAPNLSVPTPSAWYSEPFAIEVSARDNHNLSSIASYELEGCTGPTCTHTITVPIGTICAQTGTATCAIYVNATDQWENTAEAIIRTNVDLNAPQARHEWLEAGLYHKETVRIRFEAYEETSDESGVEALYVQTLIGAEDCAPHGPNYTRFENPIERSYNETDGVSFCYYATDRALPPNKGMIERTAIRYADTSPPRLTLEPSSGYHAQNKNARVTCTDEQSGCALWGHLLTNGSCPSSADGAYTTDPITTGCANGSVCTFSHCARAYDRVGYETFIENEISIDLSPPRIEIVRSRSSEQMITLDLIVSDAGSGLETCTISAGTQTVDCDVEGSITTLTTSFECPEPCMYAIHVTDAVGHRAVVSATLDTTHSNESTYI